MIDHCLSGWSL